MAVIMKMVSDTFLNKFIKDEDYKNFNFLLVSENIKTDKKYKNVYVLNSLIPPANVISEFIANGNSDRYMKKYVDYLSTSKPSTLIAVAVKLAALENSNVVLLCTKDEDEFKYLDILCQYIEHLYDVKICTYKKYKKNPEKYDLTKNKKKIAKVIKEEINKAEDSRYNSKSSYVDKSALKEKLKELSKKELKALCKQNSIDYKKDMEKKDLIKVILKSY